MGKVQPKRNRRGRVKNYIKKTTKSRRHHKTNRESRMILRDKNLIILADDENDAELELEDFLSGGNNA